MKAIESALAFTKAIGTRSIEVPEWKDENGQPVRIHWTPLTLSERERIFRGSDLKLTSYADVLHLKALDAEGKKMFDLEDKVVLSTAVESGVVQRIALEILRAPSLEDLEKLRDGPQAFAIFALADRLHMTVDDLKQRMTYEEFLGWMAFLKVREEETRSLKMAQAEVLPIEITAKDNTRSGFSSVRGGLREMSGAVDQLRAALTGMAQNGVGGVTAISRVAQLATNPYVALGLAVAGVGIAGVTTHRHLLTLAEAASRTGEKASSVEALGLALRKAGGNAGDAAKALQTLRQNLDTSTLGSGALKDLFSANGLSVNNASGGMKSLREIYQDAAGLIQSAYNEQERLTVATTIFGSEAAPSMVKAIMSGATALEKFGEGKASIDDATKATRELDLVWKELARSGDGIVATLTGMMIPALEAVTRKTLEWGEIFGNQRSREGLYILNNQNAARTMGQSDVDAFYNAVVGRGNATRLAVPKKEGGDTRNFYDRALDTIGKHVSMMEADARAVGLSAGAHERMRTEAQLLDAAIRSGLDPAVVKSSKQFQDYARRAQEAADALAAAKLKADLFFERDQMGRSPIEQQVFGRLRASGIDPHSEQGQFLAEQIRINETMRETGDIAREAMQGFVQDLRSGVTAGKALENQLTRITDKLTTKVLDRALNGLLGVGGGLFSSLFGTSAPSGAVGNPTVLSGLYHSGGIVGIDGSPRYVHPAHFDGAPRFHGGLRPDEFPAILQKGEGVFTRDQMRALGGGGRDVVVNVTAPPGSTVDHQKSSNGSVDVHDIVISAVESGVSSGRLDNSFAGRFNARPARIRR